MSEALFLQNCIALQGFWKNVCYEKVNEAGIVKSKFRD